MRGKAWACVLSLVLAAAAGEAAAPVVTGRVEAVTLYRGQALVTRTVPVAGPAGTMELVVSDLPEHVLPDSLFAESGDGLEVRAVRFRTRAVGQEPRDEVRKLDEQLEAVDDQIARNRKMQELVQQRLALLAKLEDFTAPTAEQEMTKGVLDVQTLKAIALFSFEQQQAAADEALKLATEARELAKQRSLLQRQRAELTRGSSRTVREALVFLEKQAAAPATLRLSYLVQNAGWSPAYTFDAKTGDKQATVEYNAIVQQMSGEDWTGVKLTLSTASPALAAQGPGLAPFRVALSKTPGKQLAGRSQNASALVQGFRGRQQAAAQGQRASQTLRANRDFNWEMNAAANDYQGLELTLGRDALDILSAGPSASPDVTSVSYQLDGAVSLASRSDQQMLRIADMKLPCTLYHVATPVLTSYVYREAELTNTGSDALLTGSVSVYLDGRFVGRGLIPTVARGEGFAMGFGADPQLRARRELVKKTEGVQGGNRELTLTYRLVLENFKDAQVAVRLQDRIPFADRRADLRVTLDDLKDKLSEDKIYLRVERPKGILRWDIDVPAKASGEKARIVEYGYRLEHDRSLNLTAALAAQAKEAQMEFEKMQFDRYGY